MYLTQGLHRDLVTRPDGVATICGMRRRTVRELADRVARLAGALRDRGIGTGDCVAYLGVNSDRMHEYYLGVFWAGGVVNPVNTRWAAPEIAYSLNDSQARCLIFDEVALPRLDELRRQVRGLTLIWSGEGACPPDVLDYEELLAQASPVADARRNGADLAGLFYTGGTTGFPKGVMLSHGNLGVSALGSCVGGFVSPGATFLHVAPMFHLADFAAWSAVTLTGGTHVMVPAFDPALIFAAIRDHKVSHMVLVPAMLQLLVDSPLAADADMSALRQISYGGSPVSLALLERARTAWPHVDFCQAYGQTELSPITTLLAPEHHRPGSDTRLLRSAGRAAPHSEVRIADQDGTPLPSGKVGEIVSRGPHVMLGYWKKPEETAAAVRNGWMHSGDAGYLDEDGFLYVVDRFKDMIVSGGENIYSTEVENALASHPAVAACAVIGVPDPKWGETVHAVVVRKANMTVDGESLVRHCRDQIAGYKCPRSVEFRDSLPLSPAGKVLKRDLRKLWDAAAQQESADHG